MLGHKAREFKQHKSISLEDLVLDDNFYRQVEHSSLSKIRKRYRLEVFQQFFEQIVELCIKARLTWGEQLYFKSTKVQANASINCMIDRVEFVAQQHLGQLFEYSDNASSFSKLVAKYNGTRLNTSGSRMIRSPLLILILHQCNFQVEVVLCWVTATIYVVDGGQSRFWFISPKQMCVMHVRSRANVPVARAGDTFFAHSFKNILIEQI